MCVPRRYDHVYADWGVHESIVSDPTLHVLHIWPSAMDAHPAALSQVRTLAAANCSSDGGRVYEKRVPMSRSGLKAYLSMAYQLDRSSRPEYYPRRASSALYTHVIVVRSTAARMTSCKAAVRNVYNLTVESRGREHVTVTSWKAACHATDFPSEALMASQIFFNDNSLAALNHGGGASLCERLAGSIGRDLEAANATPMAVQHDGVYSRRVYVLPEGMLADTGTAMALLGLRAMTDVDLIWDARETAALHLLQFCGFSSAESVLRNQFCGNQFTQKRSGNSTCTHEYETHNAPSFWFSFHNVSRPEEIVRDPTAHAFCFGLKFVAPRQLLSYKQRRFAWRPPPCKRCHSTSREKDELDVALLRKYVSNLTRCHPHDQEQPVCAQSAKSAYSSKSSCLAEVGVLRATQQPASLIGAASVGSANGSSNHSRTHVPGFCLRAVAEVAARAPSCCMTRSGEWAGAAAVTQGLTLTHHR